MKASKLISLKDRNIQYGIYVKLRLYYPINFEFFLTHNFKL